MHRQRTVRIDAASEPASDKPKAGRIRQFAVDLTGCDSPAGVTMFIFDIIFLLVICFIQGFVVARDNELMQINRGAKIKCDGAFQNFVRMKAKMRLLTSSEVAFYEASDFYTTREQFRIFANGRHFNDTVLQAIEWIPEVLHESYRTTLEQEGATAAFHPRGS